jgi:hypothetical protein
MSSNVTLNLEDNIKELQKRIVKLEDEVKKERDINRTLQIQISTIHEELTNKNVSLEKDLENVVLRLDNMNLMENISLKILSENDFLKKNFKFSNIQSCVIDNQKPKRLSYRNILITILQKMSKKDILSKSLFNFNEQKVNEKKNYHWCEEIGLSMQNKGSSDTLKEIIRLCKMKEFSLLLKIQLNSNEIIEISIKNKEFKAFLSN